MGVFGSFTAGLVRIMPKNDSMRRQMDPHSPETRKILWGHVKPIAVIPVADSGTLFGWDTFEKIIHPLLVPRNPISRVTKSSIAKTLRVIQTWRFKCVTSKRTNCLVFVTVVIMASPKMNSNEEGLVSATVVNYTVRSLIPAVELR